MPGILSGFSFCGRHCNEFGIQYAPGPGDGRPGAYDVYAEEVLGRHGGYYFRNRLKPRTFVQPCYFEDISRGTLEAAVQWLGRNQSGRLTFDHRPGMWYTARNAEPPDIKVYPQRAFARDSVSGTLTATLTAYDPMARMDILSVADEADLLQDDGFLRDHTGLLPAQVMPPLDHGGTVGPSQTLLLYNPGSERAPLTIQVAGTVGPGGLLMVNRNTGQRCRINNLTAEDTTQLGAYLELDAEQGRCCLVRAGVKTLAFAYHDEGYIELEGAHPVDRDLLFAYTGNTRQVRCAALRPDMAGKYAHLHGQWVKLLSVGNGLASIDFTFSHSGTEVSAVAAMNEIVLISASPLSLPTLRFAYLPRFL